MNFILLLFIFVARVRTQKHCHARWLVLVYAFDCDGSVYTLQDGLT